jgi:16S rRNA (adenine1518-N6/adenine1519-N6)-dimethyltransferase
LCLHLRQTFAAARNFSLIEGDVLLRRPEELLLQAGMAPETSYLVAGNLPYNAGAAILRHFLEADAPPERLVVMLQREVAAAITAAPGSMSILSVATQVFAEPRRLFDVPPGAFTPAPRVVSTVLSLDVRGEPLVPREEQPLFFDVVRAGFSTPRKQLHNSLANGLGAANDMLVESLQRARIDPKARAQELRVDDWLRLSRTLREEA